MFKISKPPLFSSTLNRFMTFKKQCGPSPEVIRYIAPVTRTPGAAIDMTKDYTSFALSHLDSEAQRINHIVGYRENRETTISIMQRICQTVKVRDGVGSKIIVMNNKTIEKCLPKSEDTSENKRQLGEFFKIPMMTDVLSASPETVEDVLRAHGHVIEDENSNHRPS